LVIADKGCDNFVSNLYRGKSLSRFYPIIDYSLSGAAAPEIAAKLSQAGCRMLQVRAKSVTSAQFFAFVEKVIRSVAESCRVIVNDRADIALTVGAAGVHLGEHDLPVGSVREFAPAGFIIGVTARDPASAQRAQQGGADYLGAGAVFPTGTKSDTRLIGLEGLAGIAKSVDIPVYGIAGVSLDNCALVVQAGAYGAAGITAISRAEDPVSALQALEESLHKAAQSA
jgi:thiamine-phosphate pyrophosphorylase